MVIVIRAVPAKSQSSVPELSYSILRTTSLGSAGHHKMIEFLA
jgi:hypothetical protein